MDYEDLVRKFSHKFSIPGMDVEDVEQELRTLALALQPRLEDERNPRGYVNTAMRRWCIHQLRDSNNLKARPLGSFVSYEDLSDFTDPVWQTQVTMEELVTVRENIQHRLDYLEDEPRNQVTELLANIAIDQVLGIEDPIRKQKILEEVALIMEQEQNLPECHPDAENQGPDIGYDPKEAELCQNCDAKFTCLPRAIEMGLNGLDPDVSKVDPEVAAVQRRVLTVEQVRDRISKRQALIDEEKPIPDQLKVEAVQVQASEKKKTVKIKRTGSKKEAVKKQTVTKRAPKKKSLKKKVVKKKAAPKKKAAKEKASPKKKATKPVTVDQMREQFEKPSMKNPIQLEIEGLEALHDQLKLKTQALKAKLIEQDQSKVNQELIKKVCWSEVTEAMKKALERTNDKFRQNRQNFPFEIAPGMTFEMYPRGKSKKSIEIHVTEHGFVYDKVSYKSLSAALTVALGRPNSPYREFDFNVKRNIRIVGLGVPGGVYPPESPRFSNK